MRFNFILTLLLILFGSCSKQNKFPEKKSNKIPLNELVLQTNWEDLKIEVTDNEIDFSEMKNFIHQYKLKDEEFKLSEFEKLWSIFKLENNLSEWSDVDLIEWVEITGFLLELTQNTRYAEELERISMWNRKNIQRSIAPYILTKRLDNIYVNLFQPVETSYNHTLGGEVNLVQETDYPKSRRISLHFGMTERRHMELFIRIPDWALGTSVVVKQVKYIAKPGTYCKIAKKWKEGDIVEIQFPPQTNSDLRPSKF